MKGYIIEAYNNMENFYVSNRLIEEARKRGIELDIIGAMDTLIYEGIVYNRGQRIKPREFIINRYKWGKLKETVNILSKKSYNELNAFNMYVNKYEQIRRLESSSFAKTRYVLGNSYTQYEVLSRFLGKRIVAKGLESSMGREIYLLESEDDMACLKVYGNSKEWLYEEFIESSYGRDIRVYSIRGEVVACIMRKTESDFRANVAVGAKTYLYEITDDIRQIAADIYKQTNLDFVGIDLLFGENNFYLCEINVMPGLQGVEEATGINIAGQMIDVICEDFRYE